MGALNTATPRYIVQTKQGQERTLKSAEGVVHWGNSSFVKPYNIPEETRTLREPKYSQIWGSHLYL